MPQVKTKTFLRKLKDYSIINYEYIRLGKRTCVYLPKTNLGFVLVPKCASTTIRHGIQKKESLETNTDIYKTVMPLHTRVSRFKNTTCPKVALVRNPFERIVSCYNHIKENNIPFQFLPSSILVRKPVDFTDFVEKIVAIPDFLADPHFQSQYSLLTTKGTLLVDKVYKLEEIDSVFFEEMLEQYDFPKSEPQNVRSVDGDDWRTKYTLETTKLIYSRYRKDFKSFGYEDELVSLLQFLEPLPSNSKKTF